MAEKRAVTMEKLVSLCKTRGFIFPGSEIYGGLANTWDYGPLGVELKNNVKKAWWKKFVQENKYNVGLDAAILMNPQTWVASGHLAGFSDPMMDCRECHERFRADKLIEDFCAETGFVLDRPIDAFSQAEMKAFVEEHNICCPTCGKFNWTDIRQFNLMFKTFQGVTEDAKNVVYLRPETAQGIFVNFQNVQRSTRRKLPFGICQLWQYSFQYLNHSSSVPGWQKNSSSICSNSRVRKVKLPGVISFLKLLPIWQTPKGSLRRVVRWMFWKFTKIP